MDVKTIRDAEEQQPVHQTAPLASPVLAHELGDGSMREILCVTGPLILSSTGLMLMFIIDALFLSWYSEEAIAAVGPANMAGFVVLGFFLGVTGYTSTFVAQYIGAQRPNRVGTAVWQGIYLALGAGTMIALLASLFAEPLFTWVGHAPEIQVLETRFFQIMCWSAPSALLANAISGFFSGRGDNQKLMLVQLLGLAINGFLSYGLIFGRWGLPEWGSSGAAAATAFAQLFTAMVLLALFLLPAHHHYGGWSARRLDFDLLKRMFYFGSFHGMRMVAEILAWTIFLFFVGRLGTSEIAVTNIAWRLNSFAFFPMIGLSTAISALVGQAQGARRPDHAAKVTWRGVIIAECWMLLAAVIFVTVPSPLFSMFADANCSAEHIARNIETGVVLLRFVALYCLLDGLNIVFMGALQGAGDMRWTLGASLLLHLGFLAGLLCLEHFKQGLYSYWAGATAFVMLQAFVWLARFRSGKWRDKRVIEPAESLS